MYSYGPKLYIQKFAKNIQYCSNIQSIIGQHYVHYRWEKYHKCKTTNSKTKLSILKNSFKLEWRKTFLVLLQWIQFKYHFVRHISFDKANDRRCYKTYVWLSGHFQKKLQIKEKTLPFTKNMLSKWKMEINKMNRKTKCLNWTGKLESAKKDRKYFSKEEGPKASSRNLL